MHGRGPDAGDLVGRDGDADAAAAHAHAEVGVARGDGAADRSADSRGSRPDRACGMPRSVTSWPMLAEVVGQAVLEVEAGVVGTDGEAGHGRGL